MVQSAWPSLRKQFPLWVGGCYSSGPRSSSPAGLPGLLSILSSPVCVCVRVQVGGQPLHPPHPSLGLSGCLQVALKQQFPPFLSLETCFMDQGLRGMVAGRFKHITFIVQFISIIINISAPPQIIRRQILEVRDPCSKA